MNAFRSLFSFLCLSVVLMTACQPLGQHDGYRYLLFDNEGSVTDSLSEILRVTDIEHDGTLGSIVKQTQKVWLRRGGERFELEGDRFAEQKSQLMSCFEKMNMTNEIRPTKKHYDYALLHGALLKRIRSRLAYLVKLWKEGVRFDKLVFLTGQRDLSKERESLDMMLDRQQAVLPIRDDWQWNGFEPQTEADMMRIVYDQAELPEGMRNIPFVLVNTPKHKRADGTFYRPTTETTTQEWMKRNPEPGSCIASSNQPYVPYQDTVVRTYLPKQFTLETVGDEATEVSASIYLDTLARWLYQERMRRL